MMRGKLGRPGIGGLVARGIRTGLVLLSVLFVALPVQGASRPIVVVVDGALPPATGQNPLATTAYLAPDLLRSEDVAKLAPEMKSYAWSGDIAQTRPAVEDLKRNLLQAVEVARNDGRPLMVVAHSWGGVLSYLALRELGEGGKLKEGDVDLLLTIHTPLGMRTPDPNLATVALARQQVVYGAVRQFAKGELRPVQAGAWRNYWSPRDWLSGPIAAARNMETYASHDGSHMELGPLAFYAADLTEAVRRHDEGTSAVREREVVWRLGDRGCEKTPPVDNGTRETVIRVIGQVSESVDLADDVVAKRLLGEGYAFKRTNCPEGRFGLMWDRVEVVLQKARYPDARVIAEMSLGGALLRYSNPFAKERLASNRLAEEMRRRAEEEERRRQQALRESQLSISRTIEGFTLGMPMQQVLKTVESGLKSGEFTLFRIGPPGLEQTAPMLAEETATVHGVAVPIALSTIFATRTSEAVRLWFYRSMLLQIAIAPRGSMKDALEGKYGPPTSTVRGMLGEPAGSEWTDRRTVLKFYGGPYSPYTYLTPRLGGRVALSLIYVDREVMGALENAASEIGRIRQAEEERRRKTLPKGY